MLANLVLDGLELLIKRNAKQGDKTNVVRYADDFIITGSSKELLQHKIKPAVESFLKERGLTLSKEKTKITHIEEGFDFLGYNIRKYKSGKVLTKPAKSSVKQFLDKIRMTVKSNKTAKTENLIWQLNPIIRGWTNYHKSVCAKKIFVSCGTDIFHIVWSWARRRHRNKGGKWLRKKYFCSHGQRNWVFYAKVPRHDASKNLVMLMDPGRVKIARHVKIKADATPYDPAFIGYLNSRKKSHRITKLTVDEVNSWVS